MKLILAILIFFSIGVSNFNLNAQIEDPTIDKALLMMEKVEFFTDSIQQIILVFNESPESSDAVLVPLEKKGKHWKAAFGPMQAGIGRKGFAAPNNKREGDQQSPSGLFRLGKLFCYDEVVDTKMPFIHTTPDDKWIDDPASPDYNKHVRGATQAKSYEKLLIRSDEYKYCLVIEYNMHPVVPGHGSAIFIHLSEGDQPNASAGCVVITQSDMERILKWLLPEMKPSILMGNENILLNGLHD